MSVAERLRERIRADGPITFADFMRAALYDADGYYATRTPMGFGGDYLTAPETTPLFGATLSRLASATWHALGEPAHFDVVDVGAGTGRLLRDLVEALRAEDPACASAAHLAAIEVSAEASRAQAKTLGGLLVRRARTLAALGPISGLLIANELLDALPFHLVTRKDGRVRELRVGLGDGGFAFVDAEPIDARLGESTVEEGERVAVPLDAYAWFVELAASMDRAVAAVIDYPSEERPGVRTYFRHTSGGDPLERVGDQDLTAALDFDRLADAAREAGLEVVERRTQAEFLDELGFRERLSEIVDPGPFDPKGKLRAASDRNAARAIVDPEGMGAFSVVVVAKGLRF